MQSTRRAKCSAEASRKFHKNAFKSPHTSGFFDVFQQSTNKPTTHNMKNFASFRVVTLALVAGYMLKTTSADADVTFLGVAGGDATTNDIIVWTRAKDEANPQPTAINVQISTGPTFTTGVTTLPAGTAGSPTDLHRKEQCRRLGARNRLLLQVPNHQCLGHKQCRQI
jgi:hypothetical protein